MHVSFDCTINIDFCFLFLFFCFDFYCLGRRHFGSLFINEEQNKGWVFTCLRVFAIHSGLVYDVTDTDYKTHTKTQQLRLFLFCSFLGTFTRRVLTERTKNGVKNC